MNPWGMATAAVLVLALSVSAAPNAEASPGDLDPSFGTRGIAAVDVTATRVIALADGRVVVGGGRLSEPGRVVTALMPDGEVDPDFGHDGYLTGTSGLIFPTADRHGFFLLQYVVGADSWITKFDDEGKPVPSFGGDGTVEAPGDTRILAADEYGRVTAATIRNGENNVLARFLPSGDPDVGFGADGRVELDYWWRPTELAAAPDGKLVMGVKIGPADGPLLFTENDYVTRFDPDGDLDAAWGTDGLFDIDHPGGFREYSDDIEFGRDGSVFVAGHNCPASVVGPCISSIGKLTSDGEPAPGFPDEPVPSGHEIALDDQDRPIFVPLGRGEAQGLGRLTTDGVLDERFGDGGRVNPTYGGDELGLSDVDLVSSGDATVVAGGHVVARFLLRRGDPDLDADGILDRDDSCPRYPGTRRLGCPGTKRVIRNLRLYEHKALFGRIDLARGLDPPPYPPLEPIACVGAQRVGIVRIGPDHRSLLATVESGFTGKWHYSPAGGIRPGTYLITARSEISEQSQECIAARATLVVRRGGSDEEDGYRG